MIYSEVLYKSQLQTKLLSANKIEMLEGLCIQIALTVSIHSYIKSRKVENFEKKNLCKIFVLQVIFEIEKSKTISV